jgi:hypothetical protein
VLDKHPEALATLREVRSKLMAGAASVAEAKETIDPVVRGGRRGKATAKLAKARG